MAIKVLDFMPFKKLKIIGDDNIFEKNESQLYAQTHRCSVIAPKTFCHFDIPVVFHCLHLCLLYSNL